MGSEIRFILGILGIGNSGSKQSLVCRVPLNRLNFRFAGYFYVFTTSNSLSSAGSAQLLDFFGSNGYARIWIHGAPDRVKQPDLAPSSHELNIGPPEPPNFP